MQKLSTDIGISATRRPYSVSPTRRVALLVGGKARRQQSSTNTVYIYTGLTFY